MSEMLVRLFDKYDGADLKLQAKSTGRGDVIVVAENGWAWSEIERTSYNWIIIQCPASLTKCNTMRTPEPGNPLVDLYLRMTAFHLDLDALTLLGHAIPTAAEAKAGREKDEKRPSESITITEAEFDVVKQAKPKIEDPAVIG